MLHLPVLQSFLSRFDEIRKKIEQRWKRKVHFYVNHLGGVTSHWIRIKKSNAESALVKYLREKSNAAYRGRKLTVYRLERCCNRSRLHIHLCTLEVIAQYLVEWNSIMLCMHNSMLQRLFSSVASSMKIKNLLFNRPFSESERALFTLSKCFHHFSLTFFWADFNEHNAEDRRVVELFWRAPLVQPLSVSINLIANFRPGGF